MALPTGKTVRPGSTKDPVDVWSHVHEARAWTNARATNLWNRFTATNPGRWYSNLDPRMKVGVGITAAMLALTGVRLLYRTMQPDQTSPPPAYQGAYGKIEAMRHNRNTTRSLFSDFGSGLNLSRVCRRGIMPVRHNTRHRAYTGMTL